MEFKQSSLISKKRLRLFGLTFGLSILLVFGVGFPALWGTRRPWWPWLVGGLAIVLAGMAPGVLRPVYRGWMAIGRALGWANTKLILGMIYFLILCPVGLIMRLIGRDPLARSFIRDLETYRLPSSPYSKQNMEQQF